MQIDFYKTSIITAVALLRMRIGAVRDHNKHTDATVDRSLRAVERKEINVVFLGKLTGA